MLKSLVTISTHLQRTVSFLYLFTRCKRDPVYVPARFLCYLLKLVFSDSSVDCSLTQRMYISTASDLQLSLVHCLQINGIQSAWFVTTMSGTPVVYLDVKAIRHLSVSGLPSELLDCSTSLCILSDNDNLVLLIMGASFNVSLVGVMLSLIWRHLLRGLPGSSIVSREISENKIAEADFSKKWLMHDLV